MSEPVGNGPRGTIPGNSHKLRETKEAVEEAPREKVEKIIEGKVVQRKRPWYKRAAESMVADDAQTVGDFVLVDVVIPAVKNLFYDIITQGSSRVLFGTTTARRSNPSSVIRGGLRTQYRDSGPSVDRGRSLSQVSRARHDFDDIVLDSRVEAVEVLDALGVLVDKYGRASVSDLYDLLGVSGSFTDRQWGWTDIRDSDVRQTRGGFILDLPRPELLR